MRRLIPAIAVLALSLGLPGTARAGVLSTSIEGYGEEVVRYEAGHEPSSVILVRSLPDGRLKLTDRYGRIRFATPGGGPLGCHRSGPHVAICRHAVPAALAKVVIRGGAQTDVIDARFLLADQVDLEGGAGDDTLLAPLHVPNPYASSLLTGGPGNNILVGGPHAEVSYLSARGPVKVDLAKEIGIARGERDHIVGVASVIGSNRAFNFLVGNRHGGEIWAGARGNHIVTRSASTTVNAAGSTTVVCIKPSVVKGLEAADVVKGSCRVSNMELHWPLHSLKQPPVTLNAPPREGAAKELEWQVTLTSPRGLVCIARAQAAARGVPCRLTLLGLELLRHRHHVRVLVSESYAWAEFPLALHHRVSFTTPLRFVGERSVSAGVTRGDQRGG